MGVRGLISVNLGVLDLKKFENHWARVWMVKTDSDNLSGGFLKRLTSCHNTDSMGVSSTLLLLALSLCVFMVGDW